MNCRRCQQPIERCNVPRAIHHGCHGWVHSATTMHLCASDDFLCRDMAEPEPQGEVA